MFEYNLKKINLNKDFMKTNLNNKNIYRFFYMIKFINL